MYKDQSVNKVKMCQRMRGESFCSPHPTACPAQPVAWAGSRCRWLWCGRRWARPGPWAGCSGRGRSCSPAAAPLPAAPCRPSSSAPGAAGCLQGGGNNVRSEGYNAYNLRTVCTYNLSYNNVQLKIRRYICTGPNIQTNKKSQKLPLRLNYLRALILFQKRQMNNIHSQNMRMCIDIGVMDSRHSPSCRASW